MPLASSLHSSFRTLHFGILGAFALFSACVPILGIDEPIEPTNTECSKFACVDGICSDQPEKFLKPCNTSMMCDGQGACKLATLDTCNTNTECASGICFDNQCLLDIGTGCMKGTECLLSQCVDFTCRYPDGSACDMSVECASGRCVNENCLTSDGRTCTANMECASNVCDAGICKISAGKECAMDIDCASNVCLGQRCVAQSCTGLASICGPNKDEFCCVAPVVTGGTYNRSNNPLAPATLADFRLDRFEVNVSRFRRFVEVYPESKPTEGAGQHEIIVGSAWNPDWDSALPITQDDLKKALLSCGALSTWTTNPGPADPLPINCIDWYVAFAFCAWDGGRLPTEAEWNHAAAGGNDQREYPWSQPPPNLPLIDATYTVYNCEGMGDSGICGIEDILPVGSRSTKGDGRWQQADMAGSVSEWTLDWYQPNYSTMCVDCAVLTPAQFRVRRGGSWRNAAQYVKTHQRRSEDPTKRIDDVGIRCARNSK